jgi:hypothetical protein
VCGHRLLISCSSFTRSTTGLFRNRLQKGIMIATAPTNRMNVNGLLKRSFGQPPQDVGRACGRERDNDGHCPRRIVLRVRRKAKPPPLAEKGRELPPPDESCQLIPPAGRVGPNVSTIGRASPTATGSGGLTACAPVVPSGARYSRLHHHLTARGFSVRTLSWSKVADSVDQRKSNHPYLAMRTAVADMRLKWSHSRPMSSSLILARPW